jgi:hypothetical protein
MITDIHSIELAQAKLLQWSSGSIPLSDVQTRIVRETVQRLQDASFERRVQAIIKEGSNITLLQAKDLCSLYSSILPSEKDLKEYVTSEIHENRQKIIQTAH